MDVSLARYEQFRDRAINRTAQFAYEALSMGNRKAVLCSMVAAFTDIFQTDRVTYYDLSTSGRLKAHTSNPAGLVERSHVNDIHPDGPLKTVLDFEGFVFVPSVLQPDMYLLRAKDGQFSNFTDNPLDQSVVERYRNDFGPKFEETKQLMDIGYGCLSMPGRKFGAFKMDSMLSGRSLLSVGVGKKQLLSVLSTVANMTSLVLAGIDKAVLTDEAHRKELANYGAVLDLSQGAVHALAGRFMVVDGNMQLALRLLKKDPERARDLILKALEATRKANQYMRDYFQPVKENTFKIKIKPEEIELPVLLAEMKELLKNKFKAVDGEGESEGEQKTRVELILRDGLPKMVITDKDKVFDIVLELVNNAEKYSPKGSNIRIVFQPIDEAADDTAREMLISVIDQGIGIRPDQITRIFKERDLRLHPEMQKGNSTGNGLYVSNKIVNMLGGTMKVVSEEGKGSTFSFTLPAAY